MKGQAFQSGIEEAVKSAATDTGAHVSEWVEPSPSGDVVRDVGSTWANRHGLRWAIACSPP